MFHRHLMISISIVTLLGSSAAAEPRFRGIVLDQGNNLLFSNSLNRLDDQGKPFYIDVLDNFDRDMALLDSDADTLQIGFVPPVADVPNGPLLGQNALDHGRWTHGSDFATFSIDGGFARRTSMAGSGIAATPWRVTPGLGDYYQLEMQATVAVGETVSLAYLGDLDGIGATQGLDGVLGQLLLEVSRGLGDDENLLTWTVAWDRSGTPQSFSSTTTAAVTEELHLGLGWLDLPNAGDLFDAWLGDSTGNTRLLQGNLVAAIDVHDVGFHSSGLQSTIHGFTAAVPEPTSAPLAMLGIACALFTARRRHRSLNAGDGLVKAICVPQPPRRQLCSTRCISPVHRHLAPSF